MPSGWPLSPGDGPVADNVVSAPSSHGRPGVRARIFKAIADQDFNLAILLAQYLARLEPIHADDLTVAAVAWICKGQPVRARDLLDQALELDPHQKMAAMAMARVATPLPATALAALRWHAETDQAAVDLLIAHVAATGEPQAFVAAREVRCLIPAGSWHVALRWQQWTLADVRLAPFDHVRQVILPCPGPLRGIVDPTVHIDGVPLPQGAFQASLLAIPRLAAAVQVVAPSIWHIQAIDRSAPARPVALQLRDGDRLVGRHICSPVTHLSVTGLEDIPALTVDIPAGVTCPALYAELTGEPLGPPPPPGADDGVVDVIVPVYGDLEATRACFTALLTVDPGTAMRVIAIDDASPDSRISALLDDLARQRRIALIRNPGNLGFVRSVNIGMAAHVGRDVVLLNADTVVAAGWLGRLRRTAQAMADTGTVTPWSNDATICSYPAANRPTPLSCVDVAALDQLVAATLSQQSIPLPTAVGFCMYIRRLCLAQTGWFDADAFGTGYGEENDFCLRAAALGWHHRMALDVYVGHVGGGSFGAAKQARIRSALRVLESRYPGYERDVAAFIAADPLKPARRLLDMARLGQAGTPRPLLILCADLGGGTDRFIRSRIGHSRALGREAVILRPERQNGVVTLRLEIPDRPEFGNLLYDPTTELSVLHGDLTLLGVTELELHHTMHLPPALLPDLTSWFPHRAYVHDYGWICPRYTLIDGSGRYCGEPQDPAICDQCVADQGDLMGVDMPVADWRALTRKILSSATSVGCSSGDSADRMRRYVPEARFQIQPPEPALSPLPALRSHTQRHPAEILRIVVPGAIGQSKGYDVLLACARDAAERHLPVKFLLLGYSMDDDALLSTCHVEVTGRYREDEVSALMAQVQPHIAFLPSVWPETWCYALTHVMASGLFVAAFDLGAPAERLRQRGHGLLLPLSAEATAINDMILHVCKSA